MTPQIVCCGCGKQPLVSFNPPVCADCAAIAQLQLAACRKALKSIAIGHDDPWHIACEALDECQAIRASRKP